MSVQGTFAIDSLAATPSAYSASDEHSKPDPHLNSSLPLVRWFGVLACIMGCAIFIGWRFNLALLKSGIEGLRAAQPLDAVCLCLCGVGLIVGTSSLRFRNVLVSICAAAVATLALLTVVENGLHIDFGIDRALFWTAVQYEQTGPFREPGRMAGAVVITFLLVAAALQLVYTTRRIGGALFVSVTTGALLILGVVLVGFLFNVEELYEVGLFAQLPLLSALSLIPIVVGLLMWRTDLGWMRHLSGDSAGASAIRSLGLGIVLLPFALSLLLQWGVLLGWYDRDVRSALMAIASSVLAFTILLLTAARLNRLDAERRGSVANLAQAQQALAETERRAYQQLRESSRRKDEFLAVLGHELRNPLAPIRYAVALLKGGVVPQRSQAAHAIIERQVTHMARLIDDLLDVSRITRNALELRLVRLDIREVVTNAVETVRPLVSAVGHRLELQVPAEPLPVMGDPVRLAQVLGNLLNNAAKYTDSGGYIAVSARKSPTAVEISVRDNGVGLDPELSTRIFEFFVQGERSRTRAPGGLGIGLALAQRLVQMHGGQLSASSPGPGQGSTFTVTLPLLMDELKAAAPAIQRAPVTTHRQQRVLIVDDNVDAAQSLAILLQMSGYVTHVAHDGLAAIEMADLLRPEVIILDIGMPKMNGQEAARWIRQQPWGHETLLVAVTGWGQEEDRRNNKEAGFDLHFTKPVTEEELLKHLGELGSYPAN